MDQLKEFPVVYDYKIAWGEMDAFQHVNNINYFRYFEFARTDYFNQIGLVEYYEQTGVAPVLANLSCKFRLPLKYPDTIHIGCRIVSLEDDSFTMLYRIVSAGSGEIAAEGESLIVVYDFKTGSKTSFSKTIFEIIHKKEQATKMAGV